VIFAARAIAQPSTDREWLARLLMVERSAWGEEPDYTEWAAISYVALNRASRYGMGIYDVIHLDDWRRWFSGDPPEMLYQSDLLQRGNGPRAYAFAKEILKGNRRNPIGKRRHFVHPAKFRDCDQAGEVDGRYVCADTAFGLKRLPRWVVSPDDGDVAEYEPVDVGNARFAALEVTEL